jgi:quercetin dioxygenase-like cupin family protein
MSQAPVFERHGTTFFGLTSPSRGSRENSVWRFTVPAGASGHPHRLTREETFVALRGAAQIEVNGLAHPFAAGDAIAVPAGAELRLCNPGHEPFEGVAVLPVGGQVLIEGMEPFVPPWAV